MFSIILPIDTNRLIQFKETKRVYDSMPQVKEFVMPTRSYDKVKEYLEKHELTKDVRLIPYKHEVGFNPAKALNLGVRNATYDHIIISSPEVKPSPDVLELMEGSLGKNLVCQVWDENEEQKVEASLVHKGYRSDNPGMYFLALFNKADIEAINGWDEDFMKGYAYEDNDFGERWVRAGLPFEIREDIQGTHQYHPRSETIPSGAQVNYQTYQKNSHDGVIQCVNGLKRGIIEDNRAGAGHTGLE